MLGVQEPEPHAHWPDQDRHHRNYMISRCLLPHGLLTRAIQRAGGPLGIDPAESDREREFLDRLSTSDLEHLLAELFAEYQQVPPPCLKFMVWLKGSGVYP